MTEQPKIGQFVKVLDSPPHHATYPPRSTYYVNVGRVGVVTETDNNLLPIADVDVQFLDDANSVWYFSRYSLEPATEQEIALQLLANM